MFSDLLASLQDAMKQAKKTKKQSDKLMTQTKSQMGITSKQQNELNSNILFKYSQVTSFPKSERFKSPKKQQLANTDTIGLNETNITESTIISERGIKFSKQQRFKQIKPDQKNILYPKYDAIKKNNQKAIITPLTNKQKNILGKSTYTNSTMDNSSCASLGPGTYTPNTIVVQKTAVFTKQKRFLQTKMPYTDQIPLYPKDTFTKKRPPTVSIKNQIKKNQKQISRKKEEQARQRLKMIYWKSIPLEIDRLFKNKIGPILRQNYFQIQKLKGRSKKCALQLLLDRMNYLRGGFQYDISQNLNDTPCAVIYRKSTPKPFKFPQHQPGPDQYYPKDDYVKPNAVGYTFGKFQEKAPNPDLRNYQINDQFFKKIQNIIINPQHKVKILNQTELKQLNRGPGFYDAIFSQIQRRTDIGNVKLPQLNQNNDRVNLLQQKKQVNDGLYYPKYTQIDKNIPTILYKQPINIQTAHIPEKLLFPEHWVFYDGDLNKVRAEVAKNVLFSGNLNYDQYKQYAKKINQFKDYMKRQKKNPEIGQYDVKYSQIDAHILVPNLDKMLQRQTGPIQKPEGEVDGDNLIINPKKLENHLPNIQFKKMVGRDDNAVDQDQINEGDVLLLEPKILEKKLPDIIFDNMLGRQQKQVDNENGIDGDRLILDPKLPQKHIQTINIQKNQRKAEQQKDQMQQQVKLQVKYTQVTKKVKGFVDLQRHNQVRLVPILRKRNQSRNK